MLFLLLLSACRAAPEPEIDLAPYLEDLDSDDIDVREGAVLRLIGLGRRALVKIEEAIPLASSLEVAERLREARERLRGLTAELVFEQTRIRAGEPFTWTAYLVNRGIQSVTLVRPLKGSALYRQLPLVDIEMELPDRTIVSGSRFVYPDYSLTAPAESDFVELPSGRSLELFDPQTPFGHRIPWFELWAPEPGRYRVRLVYDSSPKEWLAWFTEGLVDPGDRSPFGRLMLSELLKPSAMSRFQDTHHARIVSDWVELTVE